MQPERPRLLQSFVLKLAHPNSLHIPSLNNNVRMQPSKPKFNDRLSAYLSSIVALHYKDRYVQPCASLTPSYVFPARFEIPLVRLGSQMRMEVVMEFSFPPFFELLRKP
jgi:hypothetical protein